MRARLFGLIASVWLLLLALPALADTAGSRVWFMSLDGGARAGIQADLILTGHYGALVDGEFGPSTYRALLSFQRTLGKADNGVLDADDLAALRAKAAATSHDLGLQEVLDSADGLEITVPTKLLVGSGGSYRAADGSMALRLSRVTNVDAARFRSLYRLNSTTTPARAVTYSALGAASYSITGKFDGRFFYERFYMHLDDAVGFRLTWDPEVSELGNRLATYLASFSRPIDAEVNNAASEHADIPASDKISAKVAAAGTGGRLQTTEAPLAPEGGTFVVPVQINGALTLDFTLDSGAADVTIPADVVLTLIRTGTITADDFTGSRTYTMADGRSVPSQTFTIRSLTVGDKTIHDVAASVAPVEGSLLLGQSFLTRFSSWSIDNGRQVLVLRYPAEEGAVSSAPKVAVPAPSAPTAADAADADETGLRLALYGGLDFYGNDIFKGRVADAVQCASSCLGESQCRAFTFNANPDITSGPNCFLKSNVDRLEAYSTAIGGLFLRSGEAAPQYSLDAIDPTVDLLSNRDLRGGNLSAGPYALARTLDTCRMACIDNGRCEAFSFVTRLKQCWLKSQDWTSVEASGVVSGAKRHLSVAPSDVIRVSP